MQDWKQKQHKRISFQAFYENVRTAAILIMDSYGNILESNVGTFNSYGYKPEDLIGRHFSILFTAEDRSKNLPDVELASVLQKGTFTDENFIVHKDGSYIWSYGETIRTVTEDNEVLLVKLVYDMNKEKLLENFLMTANQELTKSQEQALLINEKLIHTNDALNKMVVDLDTFVYSASHDLKAPIANLEALINSLVEELSEESKNTASEVLRMVQESIQKLKTVIHDLSKAGKELSEESKAPVYFDQTMEEIKNTLKDQIRENEVLLNEDFSKAPYLLFSRKNVRSILYNLISNSIKYKSYDRRPVINVTSDRVDGYVVISVTDNGIGIKEEDKPKVFNLYSRVHTHVEGTGVGMAIVSRIVDNNGGRIEIDSQVGIGSTFKIYLPSDI